MAPILIQWRGDGPTVPVEAMRERKLRASTGPIAAQLFKQRLLTGNPSREAVNSVTGSRNLQLEEAEYHHAVTFRDCVFRGNYVTEKMGFPGVIENSFGSDLTIINCLFQDNEYGHANNPAPVGYAVRSYGSLRVESSCFMDNAFQSHGPVQVFGAPHTAVSNYVRSSQEDLTCEFLAVFSTQDDTTTATPVCFNSDASSCAFSQPPTIAPTRSPPTNKPPSTDQGQPVLGEETSPTTANTTTSRPSNSASSTRHPIIGLVAVCVMALVGALAS